MSNYLFTVDEKTDEVIVSESLKGSKQIHFIERIHRKDHEILYQTVQLLATISRDPDLDLSIFKALDKVCQSIYAEHTSRNP